jgi:anti-anti-sigma factor
VVVRGEGDIHAGRGLSVRQRVERGVVQLTVTGELDLATSPQLEMRLGELTTSRTRVELDLSQLAFIDVAGARSIARALVADRPDRLLELSPSLSRPVQRLFELVDLGRLVEAEHAGELRPHFPGWPSGPEGPGPPGHPPSRHVPVRT